MSTERLRSSLDEANDYAKNIMDNEIDRKTHKRDIHKSRLTNNRSDRDDQEEQANVMEITKPTKPTKPTESTENTTVTATTTAQPQMTTESTSMAPETTTVTETTAIANEFPTPQYEFKPIYAFYYGGQPNVDASQIYITTSEPMQPTETIQTTVMPAVTTSTPELIHNSIENRNDQKDFKPSIQYEHKNYRFDIDEHFVPIVGPQQLY